MLKRPTTGKKKRKGPSAAKLLEATRVELEQEKLSRKQTEEEFMETSARLTSTIENLRQLVHKQQTISNDLHAAREKELKIALSEARAKLSMLEQTRVESLENEAVVKTLETERAKLLQQIAEVVSSREKAEKEHAAEVAALHISTNSLKARLQEIFRDSLQDAIDDEKKRIEAELSLDAEAALAEVGQLRNLTSQQARQINHYRVIMDRKKIECDRLHRLVASLCRKIEKQHETVNQLRDHISKAKVQGFVESSKLNGSRTSIDFSQTDTPRSPSRPTSAFHRPTSRPPTPIGTRQPLKGKYTHDDSIPPFSEQELQVLMRKISCEEDEEGEFTDEQLWKEILWAKDARHSDAWTRLQDLDALERKRRESLRHPPEEMNTTNTPASATRENIENNSHFPLITIAQQSEQESLLEQGAIQDNREMIQYPDRTVRPTSAACSDVPQSPPQPPPPTNLRPTANAVNPYNRLSSESERILHIPLHPLQGASDAYTMRMHSRPGSAASTRPFSSYSSRPSLSQPRVSDRPVSALVNSYSSETKRKAAHDAMRRTVQSAQVLKSSHNAQRSTSDAEIVHTILYSDADPQTLESARVSPARPNRFNTSNALPSRPATASVIPSLRQGLHNAISPLTTRPMSSSRFSLSRTASITSNTASTAYDSRPLSALNTPIARVERSPAKSQTYYDVLGASSGILMTQ